MADAAFLEFPIVPTYYSDENLKKRIEAYQNNKRIKSKLISLKELSDSPWRITQGVLYGFTEVDSTGVREKLENMLDEAYDSSAEVLDLKSVADGYGFEFTSRKDITKTFQEIEDASRRLVSSSLLRDSLFDRSLMVAYLIFTLSFMFRMINVP